MSKAAITLQSTSAISKLDPTDWSRELWNAAHAMARRMIRDRAGHGIGAAYVWCLDHMRRRFGASGWTVAQAAGHAVFDRRTVAYAASGSAPDVCPRRPAASPAGAGAAALGRGVRARPPRRARPGNLTATVAYRCAT